ncbi:uncharacterized protein LOC110364635 isoform X2 [Columba livia]|uniref:uncharacterized protein LOC110364635 isoform X2 n=1 Tax=Columba livia TaxID=8932 RepID=UPI0031BAFEFD
MPPCTNCCFLSQSSSSLSVELPAGLGQGTSPLSHLSGMVDSKAAVEQDSHPQVQPVSAAMMKWYSSKHSQEALGVAALPSLCCRKRGIFPRLEHLCFHLPRKVFPWNQKVRSGDPAPNRVWRRHRKTCVYPVLLKALAPLCPGSCHLEDPTVRPVSSGAARLPRDPQGLRWERLWRCRTDTEEFWRSRAAYRIFRELPPLFFSSDIDLLLFSGPCVMYNLVESCWEEESLQDQTKPSTWQETGSIA